MNLESEIDEVLHEVVVESKRLSPNHLQTTTYRDTILVKVREAAIEELCAEFGADDEHMKVRLNRAFDAITTE